MNRVLKPIAVLLLFTELAFLLPGCAEHRYYRRNHYHTRGWYDRRHQAPPPGAHFDVEIHH